MKYLRLFELHTSTYLSAADKLKDRHPKRAREIKKWANQISDMKIDRIFPHKFRIDLDPIEEFEITDCKIHNHYREQYIEVYLSSHLTNIVIEVHYQPLPEDAHDFERRTYEEIGLMTLWKNIDVDNRDRDRLLTQNFVFDNRQDAFKLKKFLLEEYSNNSVMLELVKNLNINRFYESK